LPWRVTLLAFRCSVCGGVETLAHTFPLSPAQRNGEKRLRVLVVRTPEWSSRSERVAASQVEELVDGADECETLRGVLLHRKSSGLKKTFMLALCRHWGYKSDVWRVRGNRPGPQAVAEVDPALSPADVIVFIDKFTLEYREAFKCFEGQRCRALAMSDSFAAFQFGVVRAVLGTRYRQSIATFFSGYKTSFAQALMMVREDPLLTSLGDSVHPVAVLMNFLSTVQNKIKVRSVRIARLKTSTLITAAGLVMVSEIECATMASELFCTRTVRLLELVERKSSPADRAQILSSLLQGVICHLTMIELALQRRYAWVDSLPPSMTSRLVRWASGDFEMICLEFA